MTDMASKGKTKFYAVLKGRRPGIYLTWNECKEQVNGYVGAQHKSFGTAQEAEQYMNGVSATASGPAMSQSSPKRPLPFSAPGKVRRPFFVNTEAVGTAVVPQGQSDDVYQIEYDGAAKGNPGPAGAGALVRHPDGSVVCELREGLGSATNNVAEYRAVILGLRGALDRGIYRVRVQGDSKLVCEQILGNWKVSNAALAVLWKEALKLMQNFEEVSIRQIGRDFNSAADQLANEAVFLPETKFVSSFPSEP